MENGIIDLEAYLATPSFNKLKAHYYLYETLYTYNFEQFEKKLLTGPYGRKSHFEKVALLFEQGFIRSITFPDEKEYKEKFAKNESYVQIVGLLNHPPKGTPGCNNKCSKSKGTIELSVQYQRNSINWL